MSKVTRKESDIEREILVWLNLQPSCKAWKNKSVGIFDPVKKIYRRPSHRFSEKGTSDILGIYQGKMICLEVKSATGRPSLEQLAFIQTMQKLGAIAGIVRSLEEVKALFTPNTSV